MKKNLDLTKFEFPDVDSIDIVFPTFGTIPELLEEAKLRGFYNGNTPYNKLFSQLFFNGGQVEFKKNISDEFQKSTWNYLRVFMGSWAPKHEEKEAICAMLLSELVESKLKNK